MATLKAMFKLFDGYSTTIDKITRKTNEATDKILKASGSTDKFNDKLEKTGDSANKGSNGLKKYLSAAVLLATALKGMSVSDEFTNTSSRLGLINDGLQSQAELQDKIFKAASRSKGVYSDMANAITKLGLNAGDAFGSNDELIAFTELIQKGFKVGGASSSEQSSAMLQLTQAMGSGKLQGDEFRSITENAPQIADAIAKYVGVSKGELKELASDGAITADIIKNAMFAASDDINAKFETMPITFGDIWNKIQNGALTAFVPLSNALGRVLNNEGFQNFVNTSLIFLNILGMAIGGIVDFIIDAWNVLSPFMIGIVTAWLVPIISSLWAMLVPLVANVAGWFLMNLPLILLIATIIIVIQALGQLGVTFQDIFQFVAGLLGAFVGVFADYFTFIWNVVAAFVNFFGNVFNNPIAAVQGLFYDLAVNVLGFIESMAQGIENLINKIPGVQVTITSGITNLKNSIAGKSASIKSEAGLVEYMKTADFGKVSSFASAGSNIGGGIYNKIANGVSKLSSSISSLGSGGTGFDISSFGIGDDSLGTAANPTTVKGTGSNGTVEVDMSDEDLKYLRDIAEREYINKFTTKTLAPQINVTFGDVKETADVDQVAKRISKILKEEIETTGEGVA